MTITARATAAWVFGAANITPTIPAAAVAGDMLLLLYGTKPYNDVPTYPAGWLEIGSATDGTVGAGVDVGSMRASIAWKEHDGSEADPLVTNTTNNVSGAAVYAFAKTEAAWETPVGSGGGDASADTTFSVTAALDVGHQTGDMIVGVQAIRSDSGDIVGGSLSITCPGLTLGVSTGGAFGTTTLGGDMAGAAGRVAVTAGTSSGAPTWASTLAAAHTGSAFMVRLREAVPAAARVPYTNPMPPLIAQ